MVSFFFSRPVGAETMCTQPLIFEALFSVPLIKRAAVLANCVDQSLQETSPKESRILDHNATLSVTELRQGLYEICWSQA